MLKSFQVILSVVSLSSKLLFLLGEIFVFGSISVGAVRSGEFFFPIISSLVCLGASLAVPFCTGDPLFAPRDENTELLRKMALPKKKKNL